MIVNIIAPYSFDGSEGLLATIVSLASPTERYRDGLDFITDPKESLQVATIRHPAGKEVQRHVHRHDSKTVNRNYEVIIVRSGKVRVSFYTSGQELVCCHDLIAGDVLIQVAGGHGFLFLEESELIEVKQGPYSGELMDKVKF